MADRHQNDRTRSILRTEAFRAHNARFGIIQGSVTSSGATFTFSDGKTMTLASEEVAREVKAGYAPRWDHV